jgi:hypothetical protein
MSKKYELLRPFDLEAAKRGDVVCGSSGEITRFVGESNSGDNIAICEYYMKVNGCHGLTVGYFDFSVLRMEPLAWVEDYPVYRGDLLYYLDSMAGWQEFIAHDGGINGEEVYLQFEAAMTGVYVKNLTWKKPIKKKYVWLNIYHHPLGGDSGSFSTGLSYPTKELADENAKLNRVACVRIELEAPIS